MSEFKGVPHSSLLSLPQSENFLFPNFFPYLLFFGVLIPV